MNDYFLFEAKRGAAKHRSKFSAGFTLIEILVAVSIFVIIGALSFVSYSNSRNVRDLSVSGQNVLSALRLAQSRSLAGEDGSSWGLHLTQTNYVLFRGAAFSGSTSTELYVLPSNIEIVNINLAGGLQDVVFGRLDGKTQAWGSFDLRVKNNLSAVFTIVVDASGKTYQSGVALSPAGSRIIDARHRLFVLGWSIKTANALTLTFSDPPNPDIVFPVVMAPFFNGDKSKFDWSGSVAVAGQNQTLRIHTLSLTDTDTALSVDHDCRYNNKKVRITIDTKDIATYEADCRAVTVGPFGGVMREP